MWESTLCGFCRLRLFLFDDRFDGVSRVDERPLAHLSDEVVKTLFLSVESELVEFSESSVERCRGSLVFG